MLILGMIFHITLSLLFVVNNLGKSEPGSSFFQRLSISFNPLSKFPAPNTTSDHRLVHLSKESGNGKPTLGLAHHQPKDLADPADARSLISAGADRFSLSESDILPSGKHVGLSPQPTIHTLSPDAHLPGSVAYHPNAENPASKIRPQPEGDTILSPDHIQLSGEREHSHGAVSRMVTRTLAEPYYKITSVISRWFRLVTEAFSVAVICAVRMRLAGHYTLSSSSYVAFILIGHL
ncbi:hypothetical protein BDN67DRAFT_980153 [Paxillus ammoniavirescens]|nr:hypothetical protein BDN67DRAFT_980153 [Paxillus ammoniavirescens]